MRWRKPFTDEEKATIWEDHEAGDHFVPLGPCQVSSKENVWLFEPNGWGGGWWVRVPRSPG